MNRGRGEAFVPAPDIAFLAPRTRPDLLEGAKLLAGVLGCPQVVAQFVDEPLAGSIGAIVLLGDEVAPQSFPGRRIWRLRADRRVAQAHLRIDGREVTLRDSIERAVAFNGFGEAPSLLNAARATFFYASNAFIKAPGPKKEALAPQWLLCRVMAAEADGRDPRWSEALVVVAPYLPADFAAPVTIEARLEEAVIAAAGEGAGEGARSLFEAPDRSDLRQLRGLFLKSPCLLPLWVRLHRSERLPLCRELLELVGPSMNSAMRKAALGCAYHLLGNFEQAAALRCEILSPAWRGDGSCLVRVLPHQDRLDYQPTTAAFLIAELVRLGDPGHLVPAPHRVELQWRLIGGGDAPLAEDAFFRVDELAIARSLFENWLTLQELPAIGDGHLLLSDEDYERPIEVLERLWWKWLSAALTQLGRPTVRLRPWPPGYRCALAIRYDVDREVGADQVRDIVDIQARRCGGPNGSWYFLAHAPFNARVADLLQGLDQEHASHFCVPSDVTAGSGATAHSGARSEYWRGRGSVERLQAAGAAYGEAMLSLALPRPGWTGAARSPLWLTPLHFPLEGSTSDVDLSYFDQRLDRFRDQVASGGLVIIGSHPDCHQAILDDLLAREELRDCWAVTVGCAVERVRRIYEYGALEVSYDPERPDALRLRSANAIADLAVEVRMPGPDAPRSEVGLQMMAGRSCPLPGLAPGAPSSTHAPR